MSLIYKPTLIALSLIILSSINQVQNGAPSGIPTMTYCDLLRNASDFNEKIIRVRGAYRVGFEWSELYCSNCSGKSDRTWIEFSDEQCQKSGKIKGDRTVNVVFVGKFQTGSRYGHENGYNHQLIVTCVESAQTVIKTSMVPEKQQQKVAEQTRCK
jgi:hypothetical protein